MGNCCCSHLRRLSYLLSQLCKTELLTHPLRQALQEMILFRFLFYLASSILRCNVLLSFVTAISLCSNIKTFTRKDKLPKQIRTKKKIHTVFPPTLRENCRVVGCLVEGPNLLFFFLMVHCPDTELVVQSFWRLIWMTRTSLVYHLCCEVEEIGTRTMAQTTMYPFDRLIRKWSR